jgi:hypothetical protein
MMHNQWILLPVLVNDFSLQLCDGVFNNDTPILKNRTDGFNTMNSKDDKIVQFLDGTKEFYTDYTLSTVGIPITIDEAGYVKPFNLKLPKEI